MWCIYLNQVCGRSIHWALRIPAWHIRGYVIFIYLHLPMPAKRVLIGFGVDVDAVAGWWVLFINCASVKLSWLQRVRVLGLDPMVERTRRWIFPGWVRVQRYWSNTNKPSRECTPEKLVFPAYSNCSKNMESRPLGLYPVNRLKCRYYWPLTTLQCRSQSGDFPRANETGPRCGSWIVSSLEFSVLHNITQRSTQGSSRILPWGPSDKYSFLLVWNDDWGFW